MRGNVVSAWKCSKCYYWCEHGGHAIAPLNSVQTGHKDGAFAPFFIIKYS